MCRLRLLQHPQPKAEIHRYSHEGARPAAASSALIADTRPASSETDPIWQGFHIDGRF